MVGALTVILAIPGVALAQQYDPDEGVLVRVAGDATLAEGEVAGTVVVVGGDLTMNGTASTVVVVDGTATISGATVETLVVVRGEAVLSDGAVVTGDIWIPESDITDDGSVTVGGEIVSSYREFFAALAFFGFIFAIGIGIATILGALVFAAIAPGLARKAEDAIRTDFGKVALGGVFLWIVLPIAAVFLLFTIIGSVTAISIWVLVLPAFAWVGYLVSAVFLGHLMVDRDRSARHPYGAAALGAGILMVASFIPFLGSLVSAAAVLVGGAALALLAWRSFRSSGDVEVAAA